MTDTDRSRLDALEHRVTAMESIVEILTEVVGDMSGTARGSILRKLEEEENLLREKMDRLEAARRVEGFRDAFRTG